MFLRIHERSKDGKEHRYYSLVESVRTARGPQHRTLAYLGELNGSTETGWRRSIAAFNGEGLERQLELFASDTPVLPSGERVVQVVLDRVRWERPRDFGEVFLARHLWRLLGIEELLEERMEGGGEQIPWPVMAFVLTAARLIAPSSELAIEERFYPRTALVDICGVAEEQVNKDRLYRALDQLLPHKATLEADLKSRIGTLFEEPFDILLYDLTSTYFEGLAEGNPQARRGYSRDHRPDCVQVVIGLVVTKSGLPLGYEVFAGNQAEPTTLDGMMAKMEALYGKASRIWVFDRGVASERNLEALRRARGLYLVGTPRTLLRKVEAQLLEENWTRVREGIEVKRVASPDGSEDTFILCRSTDRRQKEAAIHDRFERRIEERLGRIQAAVQAATAPQPRRAAAAPGTPQVRVLPRRPCLQFPGRGRWRRAAFLLGKGRGQGPLPTAHRGGLSPSHQPRRPRRTRAVDHVHAAQRRRGRLPHPSSRTSPSAPSSTRPRTA